MCYLIDEPHEIFPKFIPCKKSEYFTCNNLKQMPPNYLYITIHIQMYMYIAVHISYTENMYFMLSTDFIPKVFITLYSCFVCV